MAATATCSIDIHADLAFVIDDDGQGRELIAATLTQLGMEVEAYDSASDAFASFDIRRPAFIFLDVALLRSDAIDVLRGLGDRRYNGVVQLMSGGRPSLLQAVQRIGVRHGINLAAPLSKPIARETIDRTFESVKTNGASPRRVAACGIKNP